MFAQAEESKLSIGAGGLQLQNASLLDAKLSAERTAAELSSQVTYLTHSLTTDRPSGANALFCGTPYCNDFLFCRFFCTAIEADMCAGESKFFLTCSHFSEF